MLYLDIVVYFSICFQQLQFNPLLWSSSPRLILAIFGGITILVLLFMSDEKLDFFKD